MKQYRLEKRDRHELIAALSRYVSNEGFMNDIGQQGVDEVIAAVVMLRFSCLCNRSGG